MKLAESTATLASLLEPHWARDRLVAAGMSEVEAAAKGQRFARCARVLLDRGNSPADEAIAVFVPGRIEVLGKHTDYCGGRSLLCTVERGLCFLAVARNDASARIFAVDLNDSVDTAVDAEVVPPARHWSNYPITVCRRVARNFPGKLIGADIAVSSDLPPASGLSSSSAMIVGTFLVLSAVNDLPSHPAYVANIHSQTDLAGYLGCNENGQTFAALVGDRGVGTFGGSQDHTAILCCKPGKLSVFSFCPVVHERDIDFPAGLQFVIADSGVIAEKTGDALQRYNDVSLRARRLVEIWNASHKEQAACLREVNKLDAIAGRVLRGDVQQHEPARLDSLMSRFDQYMIEADKIIPLAAQAVAAGDFAELKRLVNDSQSRSETQLLNQTPETIALQRDLLARGALAASAFGAGFGGSVWGLFQHGELATADLKAKHFVTRPGIPATLLM